MQFLYSAHGYGNPISFKILTDDDIDFVEKKIKEKGENFAKKTRKLNNDGNGKMNGDSVYSDDPIDIFGEAFAMSPEKFEFLRGDRNFIKVIVAHVQKLVDTGGENKGLALFKEKKRKKNNKSVNQQFHFDDNAKENSADLKSPNGVLTNELYNKVINCLESYNVDVAGYKTSMVNVDPSGAYGNIKCILCDDSNEKQNTKRVTYYQPANRTAYWVLSNFTKHLEKKHKLFASQSKPPNKKVKMNTDSNSVLNLNEHRDVDSCSETHIELPLNQTGQIDLLDDKNYSIESLEIVFEEPAINPEEISNSWLYSQIGEQLRKMIAAQLTHSECTEQMEFQNKNQAARIVHIIKILGDGNCLFTSLAHQLWPNATTSEECKTNAIKLRAAVVEHILANIEPYQMFIEEYLHEIKSLNTDDASLETKCKMWVRHVLSRQGNWAGIETVKAVSRIYRVNIVTFNECGIVQMVQAAEKHYDRTILLAYRFYLNGRNERVYNHYDTVCDMDSDTMLAAAEFIMNK